MIERLHEQNLLKSSIRANPVTAILGARQTGKSTLARTFGAEHYFDLENPRDLARLDQAQLALEPLEGLVVVDEIQRKPELFSLLRFLCDEKPSRRFLILGSASRDLIKQSSETLAGRIAYHELRGFSIAEVVDGPADLQRLWLRGAFPRSFLAEDDKTSYGWREQFIQTFLERDIPLLGIRVPSTTMYRFWTMLSHYHGQILNYQELSRSFGLSDSAVRHYLEILEGTFMIRLLKPWYENIGKRLVRAPKLYLRDSGIFHSLQGIPDIPSLTSNPKLGASWEGFVVEEVIGMSGLRLEAFCFYRTHAGAETDLVWSFGAKRYGLEIKYADAPRITPSMRLTLEDCSLDALFVVYPGKEEYALESNIHVVPAMKIPALLSRIQS